MISAEQLNQRAEQVNRFISENKFPEAIEVLAICNEAIQSKTLEDQIISLKRSLSKSKATQY